MSYNCFLNDVCFRLMKLKQRLQKTEQTVTAKTAMLLQF